MDASQKRLLIDQFISKYSNELKPAGSGRRRKFSNCFKIELMRTLEEIKIPHQEFSEAIGISVSIISKCRQNIDLMKVRNVDNSPSSFRQIKIEKPNLMVQSEVYIQGLNGMRVSGL